ncbi:MAG: hypothetical protein ABR554_10365 [Pyrinomonadaceae bacterium]
MADQERGDQGSGGQGQPRGGADAETGDPGRTPGTAEGDEETADADLNRLQGGAAS